MTIKAYHLTPGPVHHFYSEEPAEGYTIAAVGVDSIREHLDVILADTEGNHAALIRRLLEFTYLELAAAQKGKGG